MTEDQLSKAEDLLRDPDSEDCERFASWYGADLIATVRRLQQPSRSEAQPSGYDGEVAKLVEFNRMVTALRSKEGDSLTLLSDNADFNGQPNNAIECNGDWTGWEDRRFTGETLHASVQAAYVARFGDAALTFTASLSDASPKPSSDEQET